jgi:hypothetical protein
VIDIVPGLLVVAVSVVIAVAGLMLVEHLVRRFLPTPGA